MTRKDVYDISQTLLKTSIEKPFGHSEKSKIQLRMNNKEDLIGLYVIKNKKEN
jgi:hypothetical protein